MRYYVVNERYIRCRSVYLEVISSYKSELIAKLMSRLHFDCDSTTYVFSESKLKDIEKSYRNWLGQNDVRYK